VMVAYSGGTLTGAFGNDGKRWDEYIDSQKRIAAAAAAAGASVILSNHSEYDNAYTKARLVAVKREVGEENPFISSPQSVQSYFTVIAMTCTVVEPVFVVAYGRISVFTSAWPVLRVTVSFFPSA